MTNNERQKHRTHCFLLVGMLALLLAAPAMMADQSFRIGGNTTASFTVPNIAPFNTLASTRIEFRLHGWVLPAGNPSQILDISENQDQTTAVSFFLQPTGELCAQSWADVMGSYGSRICTTLNSRSDILVRYSRDTVNKRISLETWDTVGGGYTLNTGLNGAVIDAVILRSWAGKAVIGGQNLYFCRPWSVTGGSARMAWLKWHAGVIGTGAPPPRATSIADLGDWRFEGNGANQAGTALQISGTSNAFETSPNYAPVSLPRTKNAPGWTNWQSVRAGQPNQLDGTASYTDETGDMGYQWEHLSGPTKLEFDDPTSAQPVITGLIFGTYTVRLTVTSPIGKQHIANLTFGSVATDSKGVVVYPDPRLNLILGGSTAFGKSPWPYLDNRHKALSEYYGELLNTRYVPTWRTMLTGTVNVQFNSNLISGVNTSFNTELDCQTSREAGDFISIRYADNNISGGFRYRASKIKTCTANAITLEFPWDGPTLNGAQFGKFRTVDYGYWNGGGDGANYYDNVLAHYSMYYRSGNTLYRDYARELADRFIEAPLNDYFGSNGSGGYYNAFAPRVRALSGLMLRALDGRPEIWSYLWNNVWNSQYGDIYQNGFAIDPVTFLGNRDPREEAYQLAHMSLAGMLYPLELPEAAAIRAKLVSAVSGVLTKRWQPTKRNDGSQRNYYYDRVLGQAVVTKDSRIVAAKSGTSFAPTVCNAPNRIWFVRLWLIADQDTVSYACVWNSATQLTLATPYQGTSGVKNYTAELINAPPTQPFMQGIVSTAMFLAWQATGSEYARQHVLDTMDWITKFGWRPQSKGLYYIRSAVDCESDPESQRYCVDQGDNYDPGTREYAAEVLAGFGWAYLLNPVNKELLERGDLHAGVLFGAQGFGGPSTGDNLSGPALIVPNSRQGKYFGFYFGFGNVPAWTAARVGGVQPEQLVLASIPFDLSLAPAAQSVRLSVIRPNGETTVVSCDTSPCTVQLDARQGSHWAQLEYLDSLGAVLKALTPGQFLISLPYIE